MTPTITCRFRFSTRVALLSADSPELAQPSRWMPPPLPSDGSARWTAQSASATDRPTVSIIRGRGR